MRVNLSSYGNYSNNYGAHSMRIAIGSLTLYFSYRTVVAFQDDGHSIKVIQNQWGSTTGKHLNFIDGGDKVSRLTPEKFNEELKAVLAAHNLEM